MIILPSCDCVSTTVWLHHLDMNKAIGEKPRWEQYKNAVYCFEQVPEAAHNKITTVWLLISNHTNYPSKMERNCELQQMDTVLTDLQRLTFIRSVQALDAVTRTCQEWWLIGTAGEVESKEPHAISITWWYVVFFLFKLLYIFDCHGLRWH